MTFQQLLILVIVVNEGSFSRAARKLEISQAAVSAQIKALEREVGQVLLVRRAGAGKPELTAAGRLAYKTATTVLRALQNLTARLDGLGAPKSIHELIGQRIEVASDPVPGLYLLPCLAEEFRRRRPTAEVRVLTDTDHRAILDLL